MPVEGKPVAAHAPLSFWWVAVHRMMLHDTGRSRAVLLLHMWCTITTGKTAWCTRDAPNGRYSFSSLSTFSATMLVLGHVEALQLCVKTASSKLQYSAGLAFSISRAR